MVQSILTKLTALVQGGQAQGAPPVERRASKRHIPQQMTPCQLPGSTPATSHTALVHDLSLHGAGILSERAIEPGTIVQLLLVNASHTCAMTVEYEVLRCTRSPAGTYFLGGRFRRPLTHDEMVPFLV